MKCKCGFGLGSFLLLCFDGFIQHGGRKVGDVVWVGTGAGEELWGLVVYLLAKGDSVAVTRGSGGIVCYCPLLLL